MTTYNDYLLCNNFAGIKRINSSFSSSVISASDIQNVELFNTGINSGVGIRKMKGNEAVLILENSSERIINAFESTQNSETHFFIHTEDESEGKIYQYNSHSGTLTLKAEGLDVTGQSCGVDFAQGWSDLFIFSNGVNLLSIQLDNYDDDGNSAEVTTFEPTDVDGRNVAGMGLVVFDGRLWIYNGVVLWYSVKEDCYDFSTCDPEITTSAGYIELTKKITAILPYLGSLAIFHKDSSCLLSVNSDYSYSISDDSPGGCASANALVFHGTELYFYDDTKKGVFSFSQIINGDTTLSKNIALDVQEELIDMDSTSLENIKMLSVILSDRNEIWFLIPNKDDDYSIILIYDYIHEEWVKRKCQKLTTLAFVDKNLYSASENKMFLEYSGDDFDGEFIQSYYYCSPLNLSADNTLKILYIPPRITLDVENANDFMVQYIKNYDSIKTPKTKHIKSKTIKNLFYWDTSCWDSSAVYRPKETNSIKKLPPSTFKTLEIRFYTGDADQDFSIKNIEFSRIKVKQL
ncbi:MAG: hypothetical protein LUB59_07150 [Candidatus Gastranaerophilales bacterium]|nr:hypothetical protein [Candidatus Gastranaerophilales bacterium]